MKEELVSFETAKLAKEKGFGLESYTGFVFDKTGNPLNLAFYDMNDKYARPTQSLLQRWLREEHKIYVFVEPTLGENFGMFAVYATDDDQNDLGLGLGYESSYQAKTYEDALESGLQKALNLL